MDRSDWFMATMVALAVVAFGILVLAAVGENVGKTQVIGYVVNVRQASWPWPHTTVTFTIEHPTSIVDASYFYRSYYGYHEFDLHQRYRITADRDWFEWYPRIVEVEIVG